jgi:DNA-binding transcriptional MerR regulator
VTPRELRFYEDKELLNPTRVGGNRVYSAKDRVRLQLILHGKSIGFSLAEVSELMNVYDFEGPDAQLELSRTKFASQIEKLKSQQKDLEIAIKFMEESCKWIDMRLADPKGTVSLPAPEIELPQKHQPTKD